MKFWSKLQKKRLTQEKLHECGVEGKSHDQNFPNGNFMHAVLIETSWLRLAKGKLHAWRCCKKKTSWRVLAKRELVLNENFMTKISQRETSCMQFWSKLHAWRLVSLHAWSFAKKLHEEGLLKGKLHAWRFFMKPLVLHPYVNFFMTPKN